MLLVGAAKAGADASDLRLCFKAADSLAGAYDVDALQFKLESATKMSFRADAPTAADNCRAALQLVDQLVLAEDYPAAGRLLNAIRAAAPDETARLRIQNRGKSLDVLRLAAERAAPFLQKLKSAPDDPSANLIVGQYHCFSRGDWKAGLPFLLKSGKPPLSDAASRELANPTESDGQAAVGDAWWALAEKENGSSQLAIRRHAADWYRSAIASGKVSGLKQSLFEKRIAQIPKEPGDVINLLTLVDPSRDVIKGNWKATRSALTVAAGEFCRIQFPYEPPEEYDFRIDFSYTNNGGPIIQICPLGDGNLEWFMTFDQSSFQAKKGVLARGPGPFIKARKPYTSLVKVRRDRVQAYLNDTLICEYGRNADPITAADDWKIPNPHALGLAVWNSDTTFTRIELSEVTGTGKELQK